MQIYNLSNLVLSLSSINRNEVNIFTILIEKTILHLTQIEFGLTIQDLQIFIFVVTFLRFFMYTSLYNIKTGFYITCISLFSAILWYLHLIFILKQYNVLNLTSSFSGKLWVSYVSQQKDTYDQNLLLKTAILISRFLGNTNNSYRIDPLSMSFSIIPEPIKQYSDKIYYTLWDRIGPSIFVFLAENVFVSKMSFLYLLIIRYGKRYCPYLIRWHWTYIMLYTIITPIFIGIPYNLEVFAQLILLPEGKLIEYFCAQFLIILIITTHLLFILFPLFHALLGQYFFIPYLTKNVELHVGLRPKNSVYSGGYAAWQEYSIFLNEEGKEKMPFKLWWGWFGRGNKPIGQIKSQKNRRKIYNKLKKFIKNLFKIFKQ